MRVSKQVLKLYLQVAPHEGLELDENEYRAYDVEQDEYHHKATRTLFIGNLEKDITALELRKHFDQFGEIIVSNATCISPISTCSSSIVRVVIPMNKLLLGIRRHA